MMLVTLASGQQKLSVKQLLGLSEKQEQVGDIKEATRYLNEAASIEWENKQYQQAIGYFNRSLQLNERIKNLSGISKIHTNLGMIYADLQQYEKSLEFFELSLQYRRNHEGKPEIISCLINKAVVLNNLKQYTVAAQNLEEALKLATEMSDPEQMKSCYGMLAETYEKAGDKAKTLFYFDLYRTFHEMIQRKKEAGLREDLKMERLRALEIELEKKNQELELLARAEGLRSASKTVQKLNDEVIALMNSAFESDVNIAVLKREDQIKDLKLAQAQAVATYEKYALILIGVILTGSAIFLIMVVRNLREKKALNAQLNLQNEEIKTMNDNLENIVHERTRKLESTLEQLNIRTEVLTEFSYTVSHNLRGPVARILGLNSLFNKTNPSDPYNLQTLEHLTRATNNLDEVVKDLSTVLEVNDHELEYHSIDLVHEVDLVVQELLKEIDEAEAVIETDLGAVQTVQAVKAYLHSILYNLIANALKFRDEKRKPVIRIKSTLSSRFICLSIEDNGIGIDLSIHPPQKLFRFYQRANNDAPGKGLGLYLVKTQCEAMLGRAEVESTLNMGSVFKVYLPINPKAESELRQLDKKLTASLYG
jgi:signal transduction histidine kinase